MSHKALFLFMPTKCGSKSFEDLGYSISFLPYTFIKNLTKENLIQAIQPWIKVAQMSSPPVLVFQAKNYKCQRSHNE